MELSREMNPEGIPMEEIKWEECPEFDESGFPAPWLLVGRWPTSPEEIWWRCGLCARKPWITESHVCSANHKYQVEEYKKNQARKQAAQAMRNKGIEKGGYGKVAHGEDGGHAQHSGHGQHGKAPGSSQDSGMGKNGPPQDSGKGQNGPGQDSGKGKIGPPGLVAGPAPDRYQEILEHVWVLEARIATLERQSTMVLLKEMLEEHRPCGGSAGSNGGSVGQQTAGSAGGNGGGSAGQQTAGSAGRNGGGSAGQQTAGSADGHGDRSSSASSATSDAWVLQ